MAENEETGSELRERFEQEKRELQLELAVTRAGIDTTSALGQMFVENLKNRGGEVPSSDDLSTQWEQISGNLSGPSATPSPNEDPTLSQLTPNVPGASPEALESLRISEQVAENSAGRPPQEEMTASEAAWAAMQEEKQNGSDQTAQEAAFFGTLLSRAAAGDETAIWTAQKWEAHLADHGERIV